MHEIETVPPLDTQYLSHLRDEIGVVDPIEMVDLVSMETATVHPQPQLVVASTELWSPTMFCAVAGTSTRAQIHVAHDGHTGRP